MEDSLETEMIEAPTEDVGADVDAIEPAEGGQVEGIDETVEQPSVLDLEEFGNYVVDIDGEMVSVADLKGGGLRQADYTRKTQDIAERGRGLEQAEILHNALMTNRKGTIEWLAQENGLTIGEAQAAAESQFVDDGWSEAPEQPSALEQRLAAMETRYEQEDATRQLQGVFDGLGAKYGDDFNAQEVAKAADARNIYDPNLLEMVYKDLAYEKIMAGRSEAATVAQQQLATQTAERQAAAAEAAAATGAGASAGGTVDGQAPPRHMTTREAAELAWSQINGD